MFIDELSGVESGDGGALLVLYTPCVHTHVFCIKDHSYVFSVQYLLQFFSDLVGHALLHLGAAAEVLHNAIQLGQTDHFAAGDVGYMRLTDNGYKVVFAGGRE